jgi:hypothetical protein
MHNQKRGPQGTDGEDGSVAPGRPEGKACRRSRSRAKAMGLRGPVVRDGLHFLDRGDFAHGGPGSGLWKENKLRRGEEGR